MGYQGKMHRSRSNYKGGYHLGGTWPTMTEPNNRFFRRHGRFSELAFKRDARKNERRIKLESNKRLVHFHFLHHDL